MRGLRSTCINLSSPEIFLTVTPFPRRVTDVARRFRCYELRSATVADVTITRRINAMELIGQRVHIDTLLWSDFLKSRILGEFVELFRPLGFQ